MIEKFSDLESELIGAVREARMHAQGRKRLRATTVRVPDVRLIRKRTRLTQEAFAEAYHIPLGTVQNWEQGRRRPDPAAIVLLNLIEDDPAGIRSRVEEAFA